MPIKISTRTHPVFPSYKRIIKNIVTNILQIALVRLVQKTSGKKAVTLSLNEVNYERLREACKIHNERVEAGKVQGKNINASMVIDELIVMYLKGPEWRKL